MILAAGQETSGEDFLHELSLVERLIRDSRVHMSLDGTHLAVAAFGQHKHLAFSLTGSQQDALDSLRAFHRGRAPGGLTVVHAAMRYGSSHLLSRFARPSSRKVLLLVLDDTDDAYFEDILQSARALREAGISLNIVTVKDSGLFANYTLSQAAGLFGPGRDHLLHFDSFSAFDSNSTVDLFVSDCS